MTDGPRHADPGGHFSLEYPSGTTEPAPAAAPSAPQPAAPQAAAPQAAQPAPGAPVAAVAPTAPAGPATPTADARPAPAAAVTQQVFPEITRLVSRGNGTHRVTLTLQPEQLGEVRVTLTVRQGEVHVRLAAGEEAQRALAEGAPELRRVLELTGATDTRVVVRDLGSGTPTTGHPTTASFDDGRGDTAAAQQGRDGTPDQHAGTRGGTTARDGASDEAGRPRPEPVRHARSAGVDLTM